jgi:hypothetical protein
MPGTPISITLLAVRVRMLHLSASAVGSQRPRG